MAIDETTIRTNPRPTGRDHESLETKGMLCDPGAHFVGRFEVERKYRVADLDVLRSRITDLGAIPFTLGNRETDLFLDTPDRRLAGNGQQHVLRLMQPSGRVLWISKGPEPDRCVAMDLTDFERARTMLLSVGFVEDGQLTKSRDIYFLDDFHVTLDALDDLGTFAEFAVMTDDENSLDNWAMRLEALAGRLDLSPSDRVRMSYRSMTQT